MDSIVKVAKIPLKDLVRVRILPIQYLIKTSIAKRKLSDDDIKYILENKDTLSKLKMSKLFGVSDKTIAKIIKNNGYII